MQTYIVRIYRRNNSNPEQVVGRVEDIENEDHKTFQSAAELLDRLKCVAKVASAEISRLTRTKTRNGGIDDVN